VGIAPFDGQQGSSVPVVPCCTLSIVFTSRIASPRMAKVSRGGQQGAVNTKHETGHCFLPVPRLVDPLGQREV
jgi:hypothetical protein